jgi:hypothetical protein
LERPAHHLQMAELKAVEPPGALDVVSIPRSAP